MAGTRLEYLEIRRQTEAKSFVRNCEHSQRKESVGVCKTPGQVGKSGDGAKI